MKSPDLGFFLCLVIDGNTPYCEVKIRQDLTNVGDELFC
jgi:hypothetical protein